MISINYNSTYGLLDNAQVGGCGTEPNTFELIDENFLAGHALAPYNSQIAANISSNVERYLGIAGYQGNDRREALFHVQIPVPPLNTTQVTIEGKAPNCPTTSSFWITSEIPNPSNPIEGYSRSVNDLVPVILDEYMTGNISGAKENFNLITSWWTGTGFMDQAAQNAGYFSTRDLAYYLFCQRATNFTSSVVSQVEARLWANQNTNGLMWTTYNFNGSVIQGHASNEADSLTLLAYEAYIWWPSSDSSPKG